MKTLTATNQNTTEQLFNNSVSELVNKIIITPMKKLTNVSPFLLLLAPVFVMMILSFSFNAAPQEEAAMKTSGKATSTLIKVTDKLLK